MTRPPPRSLAPRWPPCAKATGTLELPDQREPPTDPADHAEDFSRRYAIDLEIVLGQAMMDLGIPDSVMGGRDHTRGSQICSFFPGDREGGTVSPAGQITLGSGIMNPELMSFPV